jgi:chromate transporter
MIMNNLLILLYSFGKIGLVSLGGGNSMLKLIEYEAVVLHHWISREEFVRMIGSSFLFPGLTAVKLSALIGYKIAGLGGLILAVLALNLPGLLMTTIGYGWLAQHNNPAAQKLMIIVQYGALALLSAATVSIAQDIFTLQHSLILTTTCILFFLALAFLNTSPFWGLLVFIGTCFLLMP